MANEKSLEAVGTGLTVGSIPLCNVQLSSVGLDGGEPIDNTCLTNTLFVTKQPQALVEVPDIAFTCDYHPEDLALLKAEINKNQELQIVFYGLGTLTYWGYLRSFTPNQVGRGEAWRASGVIVVTNLNGSAIETPPSWA